MGLAMSQNKINEEENVTPLEIQKEQGLVFKQSSSIKRRSFGLLGLLLAFGTLLTLALDGMQSFGGFVGFLIVMVLGLSIQGLIISGFSYLIFLVFGKNLKANTLFLIFAISLVISFVVLLFSTLS